LTPTRRARTLAGTSFLLVGLAIANWPTHAQAQSALSSADTRAVATYESVGLYWSNPGASASTGCEVKFHKSGDTAWMQGLAMWFDARNSECRGSIVSLAPATTYQVEFNLPGQAASRALEVTTWSNQRPVAKTIPVVGGAATLNITEGGTAAGYVVYEGNGATLDALNASQFNVSVNASYVILRGLTLKGAQQDAIRISPDVKDVIIEDNDISGWGRTRDGKWGTDMDSGVRAVCRTETLERVTIQRNKIHDPRYSANSWTDGHPAGPQGITISYCGGNHVIRHNEIYSTNGNYFNDVIGGEDNFSTTGFPNNDTDIYGNKLSNSWDDGIEAEGGNKNVRIWGNYIDSTATGIATTIVATGPVYIFRNVFNRNKFFSGRAPDQDERQPFFKSGSSADFGNGRRYIFHNTMLQAADGVSQYGLGGGAGVGGTGNSQLVHNTISMNNIYHLWKPNSAVYQVGDDNTFQSDMFNGNMGTAVINGINATPTYATGNGWQSESGGQYQLAAGTPGVDQGTRIPNFNDNFLGTAPDVGAAESGAPAMKFAKDAATDTTSVGGTAPPPPTPSPAPPPPTTIGSAPVSTTIDSSSYTIAAGNSVTFTVVLMGNSGTPSGTVNFQAEGTSISGCSAVAIANGRALCTTSSLTGGTYKITGLYSGDATYGIGQAGPITQTVTGAPAYTPGTTTKFTMDSSKYTTLVGESVTFTVMVPNNLSSAPTGTVKFTDNGNTMSACSAVALTGNVATCTMSTLTKGNHKIRGVYSGDGTYAAGVAGPITQTVMSRNMLNG
jgi:hypothetical protein